MKLRYLTPLLLSLMLPMPCISAIHSRPPSACELGETLVIEESYGIALKSLDECLSSKHLTGAQRAKWLKVRAWAHLSSDNPSQALNDQEKAVKLEPPENRLEIINYVYILRANKEFDKALRILRMLQAKEAEANILGMQVQYQLGWTLREAGKNKEAVSEMLRAIPSQPEFPYIHWQLALAYEALSDRQNAKQQLREFLQKCVGEWRPTHKVRELEAIRKKLAEYGLDEGLSW